MIGKEILDNAPVGATHIDNEGDYWLMHPDDTSLIFTDSKWEHCFPQEPLQSLDDIKRIAELEKEISQYKAVESWVRCFKINELEAHNLEQQAKGLIDFSITYNEMATNPLTYCANVLLGKTKALKDQG